MIKSKNRLALLIIFLFSVLMIIPFLKVGQLGVHSDWSFHSARVQQIFLNLKRGHFITYIATDTFSKVGNGNFLFYPVVFLYPWALLKFIFTPIIAYLIYVWLLFLATGLIAFFCMQSFNGGKSLQSLYFSLIYLIAPYHLYLTVTNYVLGEAIAYTFIPIVLIGAYNLLYKDKWITLSVGMTLMAYTHYVTLFISVEVCAVIFICYLIQYKKIYLEQLLNIFKAIGLFILLSLWQFTPLITDYIGKSLVKPAPSFSLMQSLGDFINSAFSNDALNRGGIGLLLVITLLFGWQFISKDSKYMWVYIMGLLFTLMITTVFPWQYFVKTPLSVIQFPYRYTGYAIALLATILAKALAGLSFKEISQPLIASGIILILLILYAGSIYNDLARNLRLDKSIPVLMLKRQGSYKTFRDSRDLPIIINNANYDKQFSYGALYGETDYMPQNAFEKYKAIFDHKTYVNGKTIRLSQNNNANSITYNFKLGEKSTVNLPTLAYSHTKVMINGRMVQHDVSSRDTVSVKLDKGTYGVTVLYKPSYLLIVSSIIAVISWGSLIVFEAYKLLKIKNRNIA